MIPRLRSMVVDGQRTILILDRCDATWNPEGLARGMTDRVREWGLAGVLVFAGDVDIDDGSRDDDLSGFEMGYLPIPYLSNWRMSDVAGIATQWQQSSDVRIRELGDVVQRHVEATR